MNRKWFENVFFAQDDGAPGLGGFEDDEPDLPEIITLRPGEEVPQDDDDEDERITMSKEEFEALKNKPDTSTALLEGLKGLQEAISTPAQPVNVSQKPGETDEEFESRLEQELWKEGNSAKAIKSAIQRYGNNNQMSQVMAHISAQNKQLLELSPEKGKLFKKYKGEIEQFVKSLPAEQQVNPQVWEYAYGRIKETHNEDIINENVEDIVARRVKEALAARGIQDEDEGEVQIAPQRKPFMESGRSTATGSAGTKKKKRVFVTEADRLEASRSGVPVEEYLRKIGKLS